VAGVGRVPKVTDEACHVESGVQNGRKVERSLLRGVKGHRPLNGLAAPGRELPAREAPRADRTAPLLAGTAPLFLTPPQVSLVPKAVHVGTSVLIRSPPYGEVRPCSVRIGAHIDTVGDIAGARA